MNLGINTVFALVCSLAKVIANTVGWIGSKHIYKVVDAMVHAVTSTRPKLRYVIAWDHKIGWGTLSYLPSEIQDLAYFSYPKAKGIPNHY